MNSLLVHPSMLTHLTPTFYPSLCAIQQATVTADAYGEMQPTWANVSGLAALPCRIAPATASENRTAMQIYATITHVITLNGYYAAITEKMIAIVDGVTHNIEGVQHDGAHVATRLLVKVVR